MEVVLGYLVLPAIVFMAIALLYATDPRDINVYVALYRWVQTKIGSGE